MRRTYPIIQHRQPGQPTQDQMIGLTSDPVMLDSMSALAQTPMPDAGSEMLKALMNDDNVPEELKEEFFFVFSRDNILTFLDENRKRDKLLGFDIMKIDSLNSSPYYEYTFDQERKWGIMRNAFEMKMDRALGTKDSNQKNERTTQQTQFSEQTTRSEDLGSQIQRPGIFKRIFGRR